MTPFELLKLSAATWAICYMVTKTSGPFGIFEQLREFKGGRWHGRSGHWVIAMGDDNKHYTNDGLLDCIICLSIWVALALLLIGSNVVTDAFAVAGVALLAHSYSGWRINI